MNYYYIIKHLDIRNQLDLTKYRKEFSTELNKHYGAYNVKVRRDGFSFSTSKHLTVGEIRKMGIILANISGLKQYVKSYDYIRKYDGKICKSNQLFVKDHKRQSASYVLRRTHAA